jgi:hypothetical protein
MLKTETNTPTMGARIESAFRKSTLRLRSYLSGERAVPHRRRINADFEHGQWWITDLDTGAQWSVHDTNGKGFCFEQVSQGLEE